MENNQLVESNNSYLFIWNYKGWSIEKLMPLINQVKEFGFATDEWRVASHKKIQIGDKAYITRVNDKEKGIFASGTIIKKDFLIPNSNKKSKKKLVPAVLIEFNNFFDPRKLRLDIELVKKSVTVKQKWPPQSSGTQIKPGNVYILETLWKGFLASQNVHSEEIVSEQSIVEGTPYQIIQTRYERNNEARTICLKKYGYSCFVCDFNFERVFGDIGKDFIHVHHLNPISDFKQQYVINPETDLRPVCPNCHAMLHSNNPPLSIEVLKVKINN